MRLTHTSLIAAVGFGTVWIAAMASCSEDDPNNLLTTNATMMQTTGGSGGTSADGGNGTGADGGDTGTGGNPTTGGNGGTGGAPEEVINGCTSATAIDLTAATPPHVITYPLSGPYCIKISDGDTIDINHPPSMNNIPLHRVVAGETDGVTKSLSIPAGCQDAPQMNCPNWVFCNTANTALCGTEPHYCPNSPYRCPDIGVTGPLNKVAAKITVNGLGVFPWYDDLATPTGSIKGVVYVE